MAFEPSENPITNPTRESYTELRPFRFWCQKVLPLVYDDSLSYYELLCKVVDYLNKTMEDVDHMNTDIDTLYSSFQEFQEGTFKIYNELVDYVNTYFDELDVQEEINDKLDNMVEDGTFSSIIAPMIIASSSPIFVESTDDMTDSSKIYVLTTSGYIYYWNGSAFVNSGIAYGDTSKYVPVVGSLSDQTDLNDVRTTGIWNINPIFTYENLPISKGCITVYNIGGAVYQIANDVVSNITCGRVYASEHWTNWTYYDREKSIVYNNILEGTDLNNVKENKIYDLSTTETYTNMPTNVTGGILEIFGSSVLCFQRLTDLSYHRGDIYERRYIGGNWSDWYKIESYDSVKNAKNIIYDGVLDSVDLNTIKENKVYELSTTETYNAMPDDVTGGILEVFGNSSIAFQRLTDLSYHRGDIYERRYVGGNWSDWYKIESTGERNVLQFDPYNSGINTEKNKTIISQFTNGYYSTTDGEIAEATTYCRSKSLFKINELLGYRIDDLTTNVITLTCYDINFTYLGFIRVGNYTYLPTVTPKGTAFAGLNYQRTGTETPDSLTLVEVDGSTLNETLYPESTVSDTILKVLNGYIDPSNDQFVTSNNYKTFCIPNPSFDSMFTNFNGEGMLTAVDESGNYSFPTHVQSSAIGRTFALPSNTVMAFVCIRVHSDSYISFARKNSELKGKKIACIGDSITYIDGRNYGGMTYLWGYQKTLRDNGGDIYSYGYSGYALAENSENDGIAKTIIDENISFATFDAVVIFAGSNDERLAITIGDANTDYNGQNLQGNTYVGAYGKLINYIRTSNPDIKIFICSNIPSEATGRNWNVISSYNKAIYDNNAYWNVPVVQACEELNVHPFRNFTEYFYDNTHPNAKGCARIGEIIKNKIANLI